MYDNPQFPLPLLFTQPLNLGTRPTRRVKSGASETPPTPVTPKSGHKRLMPMSLAGSVQFLSAGTRLIDSLVQAQFGSQGQRTNRIPIRAVSIRSASWWTLLTGARDTLPTGAAMLISTNFSACRDEGGGWFECAFCLRRKVPGVLFVPAALAKSPIREQATCESETCILRRD
jgi:hypothetical protein